MPQTSGLMRLHLSAPQELKAESSIAASSEMTIEKWSTNQKILMLIVLYIDAVHFQRTTAHPLNFGNDLDSLRSTRQDNVVYRRTIVYGGLGLRYPFRHWRISSSTAKHNKIIEPANEKRQSLSVLVASRHNAFPMMGGMYG
ncbi:hypothetical protein Tcan_04128 [Toxocara canis]|uniref:Uncharacterized protein n=1 Tax=Toxocara canis TaxID=6265 RepID=A0A0B2VNY5_TOXCA|nr:hypothetical protein Tcan_04128 [Toxocara canis]